MWRRVILKSGLVWQQKKSKALSENKLCASVALWLHFLRYTRRFGSWFYSHLYVIGLHYTVFIKLAYTDKCLKAYDNRWFITPQLYWKLHCLNIFDLLTNWTTVSFWKRTLHHIGLYFCPPSLIFLWHFVGGSVVESVPPSTLGSESLFFIYFW